MLTAEATCDFDARADIPTNWLEMTRPWERPTRKLANEERKVLLLVVGAVAFVVVMVAVRQVRKTRRWLVVFRRMEKRERGL